MDISVVFTFDLMSFGLILGYLQAKSFETVSNSLQYLFFKNQTTIFFFNYKNLTKFYLFIVYNNFYLQKLPKF